MKPTPIIPIEVKKALFELTPEEWIRYNYLSKKVVHSESEHEEYIKFIARDEGEGGEFLDDEHFFK